MDLYDSLENEIDDEKDTILLSSPLSSNLSMRISLEAIRRGEAGLNAHRKSILSRIPDSNDWAAFSRDSIEINDLAYLSAATGDEFALLRGKNNDIIFHGTHYHCEIKDDLLDFLKTGKLRLIAHSHPDYDQIIPSKDDRDFLTCINQDKSIIISYKTGKTMEFYANGYFDDNL